MEAANERGNDVTVFCMIIVAWTVEIGRHRRVVEEPVLLAIVLAKFEAGNFRDGIGFVGWFEFAGEQTRFGHWLRRVFRIDARASEIEQAGHTSTAAPLDEV